ncbi:hypothetical protein GGR57DRAFT_409234 [Xylariaceae sp. FL1272]|nr:hypothetical protein GGR57DRAFT_409234 [Xylariaceae sp. FL1272]
MASETPEEAWSREVEDDTENDNQQPVENTADEPEAYSPTQPNVANDSDASVDMVEDEDEDSAEYDPEYNPESVSLPGASYDPESTLAAQPLPALSIPEERSASVASSRPTKKPKTAGGFLIGSSDDEDDAHDADDPPPRASVPTAMMPAAIDAQTRPFVHSALQQSTTGPEASSLQSQPPNGGPGANTDQTAAAIAPVSKSRLPADIIGSLEDRVQEDPKGDTDAWFTLIGEFKRRHQVVDARNVYERFLDVFPQAAEIWVEYLDMELNLENFPEAEALFGRTLFSIPHVSMWTAYLDYIRRRNDLLNDPAGQARQTVSQAYEFVLNNIGHDRDAGNIWQDYIAFIKSGPGQVGGNSWQDQQKMDLLRKAYQRAICVPMANLNAFWKEYDSFEMGLNKMTGRKHIQERSPAYMTARSANTALENITRGLHRTTVPRLPPAPGFDGDQEYQDQVKLWKAWIAWEKDDPLVLKSEDLAAYQQRVMHAYKHALMALRFWPEMWVDAAEWCLDNDISKDGKNTGLSLLVDGADANPESALLALKHADYIELNQRTGEDEDAKAALAQAVRAPYDKTLDSLYAMTKKLKQREETAVQKMQEANIPDFSMNMGASAEEEDEGEIKESNASPNAKEGIIKAVKDGFAIQQLHVDQTISYLWIALTRAFRRLQGQGRMSPPSGLRGIFMEARGKGRLKSDVYIAIAHLEWEVYQDPVATKLFDRGSKLFPDDEVFFVEYLKHLHLIRDSTNARVVFSQTVKRLRERLEHEPGVLTKLKPLYAYFHSYEARYGELAQVKDLEKQMAELFPDESTIAPFAARFATKTFDPVNNRLVISQAQQMRPKANIMPSVEQAPSPSVRATPQPVIQIDRSPRPQYAPLPTGNLNSPKRPYQVDETDDYNPPRKVARGVSPLKGAAGRRLDQQRRQGGVSTGPLVPIPRDISFLLGLIPSAEDFNSFRFLPDRMTRLIRDTNVPDYSEWKTRQELASRSGMRPTSSDYPPYHGTGRDSPGVTGRPASPYGGAAARVAQSSTGYRNSPLRPGSSSLYEPALSAYQPPGPSPFNPLAQLQATMANAYPNWQQAQSQQPYNGYYQN